MLKLNPNPTFTATVEIHVPGDKKEKVSFVFAYMTKDEYKDFTDRASKGDKSEFEVLSEIVKGWESCDTPFSAESFEKLLNTYHSAGQAIFTTFVNELTGARLGN